MTDWYTELSGTGAQMQAQASTPKDAPPELPEITAMIPNPATYAKGGPSLPTFMGGEDRVIGGKQGEWQLKSSTVQKLLNASMLTQDDEQLADILKKEVPDAKFYDGGDGRVIVEIQGKKAYLNAPGFSPQDLVRGTTAGTSVALAATPVGAAMRGAPLLARMGGMALAGGAGSIAQDVAANVAGAEKIVDPGRAIVSAAGGAAGELLQPVIQGIYRFAVSRGRGLYDAAAGRLTEAGRRLLQQAGANADEISDDLARQFAEQARTAANPGQALRYAEAQSLPVPVQPTRGQVTMQPADQMFEDQAFKGTYGPAASQTMQAAETAQQQALRGNIPAIQQRIAGAGTRIEGGQGAAAAQARLMEMKGVEKAAAGRLYDTAREASAAVPKAAGLDGSRAMRAAVEADHEITGLARTSGLLNKFDEVVSKSGENINSQVAINKLFDWRKQASQARQAANVQGLEDGPALTKAIGAFDDWIGQTVDDALLQGDEAAVALWKNAIGNYKEYGGRFKGKDMIQALTKKEPRGGEFALKVAPEDAANYIFGASDTGWISKANLTRDLLRMKELLGKNSEAWGALRQEAFLRFARTAEGATQGGTRMVSGVNFNNAWTEALKKNPTLMGILFLPEEKALISQFGKVAARVTNPVKGGANFSNTASALTNIGRQLIGRLGPVVGKWFAQGRTGNAINTVRAASAVVGRPAVQRVGVGVGAPIGATALRGYMEQQ